MTFSKPNMAARFFDYCERGFWPMIIKFAVAFYIMKGVAEYMDKY